MQLQKIEEKVHEVQEQYVILEFDMAGFYKTETKRLKEAVRRNTKKFLLDFMFELTRMEFKI